MEVGFRTQPWWSSLLFSVLAACRITFLRLLQSSGLLKLYGALPGPPTATLTTTVEAGSTSVSARSLQLQADSPCLTLPYSSRFLTWDFSDSVGLLGPPGAQYSPGLCIPQIPGASLDQQGWRLVVKNSPFHSPGRQWCDAVPDASLCWFSHPPHFTPAAPWDFPK